MHPLVIFIHKTYKSCTNSSSSCSHKLKEELTDWLKRELQAGHVQDPGSIVVRPELQEALEALEKRLLQHLAQVLHKEHTDMWSTVGERLQKEGLGALTIKVNCHVGKVF